MKGRRALGALGASLLLLGFLLWTDSATTIVVSPGESLQRAVASAPEGATVRLEPGIHRGPVSIDRTLDLYGDEGARIVAPSDAEAAVRVSASDVTVSGLEIEGGVTGVDLVDAPRAVVRDVSIVHARLQGIRVYKASGLVDSVSIAALGDPHAQGVEVLSAPDVVVRDSTVSGGKIGIVGHLSDTLFEGNTVTGTSLAGIVIREMGTGIARGNIVTDAEGAGLYCGDMSRCAFEDNRVDGIADAGLGRSSAGWGLVVHYHATASSHGDELGGQAGASIALAQSRIVSRSPLDLGDGWAGLIPALSATMVFLLVIAVLYLLARRFMPSIEGMGGSLPGRIGATVLTVGVAVQTFHMSEHVIQLSRVRLDGVPSMGSLVGSIADTEWVHLVYNAFVVVGLVFLLVLRKRGWRPSGSTIFGDRLIVAAAGLQLYHTIEHSIKVWQHVTTGAKVNPGLLGNQVDLVFLHFGFNAAVYLAFVAAAVAYTWRSRPRPAAMPDPAEAQTI